MKKLSKTDSELRDSFIRNVKEKSEEISVIIAKINAIITDELNPTIQEHNGILNDADEWRNELVGKMDDYISERSEKWAEGDSGQNYENWKGEWESLDLTGIEEFDEIETPEIDMDEFEQIASEPSD